MKENIIGALVFLLFLSLVVHHEASAHHGGTDHHQIILPGYSQQQMDRDGLQMRMNQQYQNQQYQNQIQQQQNEMNYQNQREQMRDQGWGRPGLDGPKF